MRNLLQLLANISTDDTSDVIVVSASSLIKTVANLQLIGRARETFDVREEQGAIISALCA